MSLLLLLNSEVSMLSIEPRHASNVILIELTYKSKTDGFTRKDYFSNTGYIVDSFDDATAYRNIHYKPLVFDNPHVSVSFDNALSIGGLKLKNTGALDDYMVNRIVEGYQIVIKTGGYNDRMAQFHTVFDGFVKRVSFAESSIEILLSDTKELLNKDVQESVYPAQSSYTETAQGRLKPVLIGTCYNISPIAAQIGQYADYEFGTVYEGTHASLYFDIIEVNARDKGVDYSGIAPKNIFYDSNNINEFGTVGVYFDQNPLGTFTLDVKTRYRSESNTFGNFCKLSDMIRMIVEQTLPDNTLFDNNTFTNFSFKDAICGVFITEKTNCVQLLDDVLKSFFATRFINESGKMEIAELTTNFLGYDLTIESYQILSISIQSDTDYSVCRSVTLNYMKNWTVQTDSDLADSAKKSSYTKPYLKQTIIGSDSSVNYPLSVIKTIDHEFLNDDSVATTLASKVCDIYSSPRFKMTVKCTGYLKQASYVVDTSGFTLKLGMRVGVKSRRYGLKIGVVTAITHNFINDYYELELFL